MKNTFDTVSNTIKKIETAMMTSTSDDGLESRPMATVLNEDDFDGYVRFFSHKDTDKVSQLINEPEVMVTYSDSQNKTFVALKGDARVTQNKAELAKHWNLVQSAFFNDGISDDDVCLIEVKVEAVDLWDEESRSMKRAFEIGKSIASNKKPDLGDHHSQNIPH